MPVAMGPVLQRIATIEARFHAPTVDQVVIRKPETATSTDFSDLLDATAAAGQLDVGPMSADAMSPTDAFATFVGGTVGAGHGHGHDHGHGVVTNGIDATTTGGGLPPAGAIPIGTPFAAEFAAAGAQYGVPPRLLSAVGWVESRYRTDAVSPAGAIGLMQIMPMTAHELGVDPTDPLQAIDGAARLLAQHHERFGSWDLALAAYHSGAGAVSRNGNTPPPRAAEYVQLVTDRLEQA